MMPIDKRSILVGLVLSLVTIIVIIAIRLPFLSKPLTGEEGTHTMLLMQHFSSGALILGEHENDDLNSCLTLIGHVDGRDIFVRPSRNLMPYCFINRVVSPIASVFYDDRDNFELKTIFARAVFLSISVFGYFALSCVCLIASLRMGGVLKAFPFLLLLYASSTVLAVGSSIQPQLDGSIGVLLLGISFLLITLDASYNFNSKISFLLIFSAGFLISLCKNEWPIALLISVIIILLAKPLLKLLNFSNKTTWIAVDEKRRLQILILWILAGIITCIFLSPSDYFSGYKLMRAIGDQHYSPWKLIETYQDLLKPLGILMLMSGFLAALNFKQLFSKNILISVYLVFACGVVIGFINSGWLGDSFPRYFAPPLLLIAGYCIVTLSQLSKMRQWLAAIFCIPILFWGVWKNMQILNVYAQSSISITVPGDTNWIKNDILSVAQRSRENPNAVFIAHSSVRYYFPGAQFVSMDYGESGAKEILKLMNRSDLELIKR